MGPVIIFTVCFGPRKCVFSLTLAENAGAGNHEAFDPRTGAKAQRRKLHIEGNFASNLWRNLPNLPQRIGGSYRRRAYNVYPRLLHRLYSQMEQFEANLPSL